MSAQVTQLRSLNFVLYADHFLLQIILARGVYHLLSNWRRIRAPNTPETDILDFLSQCLKSSQCNVLYYGISDKLLHFCVL